MRFLIIILVGVLYFANTKICLRLYPYDYSDPSTHDLYDLFLMAKYIVYQLIIFLLLILGALSELKKKFPNIFVLLPLIALPFFVATNIIDKAHGINTYHFHDILISFGVFVLCREIYIYYKNAKSKN